MIERVLSVKGVGLLADAQGAPHAWRATTLLFAENGRGKSTVCAILRSLATDDASLMTRRKTIAVDHAQAINMKFSNGLDVTYTEDAGWNHQRDEVVLFDADFIERNVHSGGRVSTHHRRNLLHFALGGSAVAAQQALDDANAAHESAKAARDAATKALLQHAGATPVAELVALPLDTKIDAKIQEAEARLTHARGKVEILQRPVGEPVASLTIDLDGLFTTLGTALDQVHDAAEAEVAAHLAHLHETDAESWVRRGLELQHGDTCPFCSQDTGQLSLIRAYRQHFDQQYAQLADNLTTVAAAIESALSEEAVDDLVARVGHQRDTAAHWVEQVGVTEVTLDPAVLNAHADRLRTLLRGLLAKKQGALATSIGTPEQRAEVEVELAAMNATVAAVNVAINANIKVIGDYKQQLSAASTDAIEAELMRLRLTKERHASPISDLADSLKTADDDLAAADDEKKEARTKLTDAMTSTLTAYRTVTNAVLDALGARFTIAEMPTNFVGGGAGQTTYAIELRGRQFKPTDKDDGLTFDIALSEGDKRTLALAFFVASLEADPHIASKVVVLDDPVCSLDRNRRAATIRLMVGLRKKAEQLVLLTHDAHLIREVRDAVKATDSNPAIFRLVHTAGDLTTFGAIDVDRECESDYFRRYRLAREFISNGNADVLVAAAAIRPLLEGHLHRRFPGEIPSGRALGKTLDEIDQADSTSPLRHAQPILDELAEIKDFANQFHHDTNPGLDGAPLPSTSEVVKHCRRAIAIVTGEFTG